MATATSLLIETALLVVELLLPGIGSLVDEPTVAVFEIVPLALGATAYVVVKVAFAPAAIVGNEQGKGVVQAPLLERKIIPGGVGSLTTTPVASEGPLFVTVIV